MLASLRNHKRLVALLIVLVAPAVYVAALSVEVRREVPKILARAQASGRFALRLEDVSPDDQRALLAVEDPKFYAHHGIDLTTPGAGWTTITQGLVKIYFFDGFHPGVLKLGKLKQIFIALCLDRSMDKPTQLRLFVNSVYLGTRDRRDVIGFQDGARTYFQKDLRGLTEDEFLALAAMVIAPNDLSVATRPAENRERVRRIKRMLAGTCKPADRDDLYYRQCASIP